MHKLLRARLYSEMAAPIDVPEGSRRAKRSSNPLESCETLNEVPTTELERVSEWCKRVCRESNQEKSHVKDLEGQIETMLRRLDNQEHIHRDQIQAITADRDRSRDHIQQILEYFAMGVRRLYNGLSESLDDARWLIEKAQEADLSVFGIGDRSESSEEDPSEEEPFDDVPVRGSNEEHVRSDFSDVVVVVVSRPVIEVVIVDD